MSVLRPEAGGGSGVSDSVAVVDAQADKVAVWHVSVDNEAGGLSRMCGAWVFDDDLSKVELLTRNRLAVVTPSGVDALQRAEATPLGLVDLAGTIDGVLVELGRLRAVYEALPSARKKTLIAPRWPRVPEGVDLAEPPRANDAGDPAAVAALGIARLLEDLATAWSALENQRTARKYLTDATPGKPSMARALPFVINTLRI